MRNIGQVALVSLLLGLTSVAHADLIGDTVTTTLESENGTVLSQIRIVGAGEEGTFGDNHYDYGAFSFEITTFGNYCGWFTCNPDDTITLTLSGLDFGGALTGVTWGTTLDGLVAFDSGADWVSWTWNEHAYGDTTYITAEFEVDVPEPGTLALLGIGLFGLSLAKRRKAV